MFFYKYYDLASTGNGCSDKDPASVHARDEEKTCRGEAADEAMITQRHKKQDNRSWFGSSTETESVFPERGWARFC